MLFISLSSSEKRQKTAGSVAGPAVVPSAASKPPFQLVEKCVGVRLEMDVDAGVFFVEE